MLRRLGSFIAAVYREAASHEISGMAAGLAFFGLFALPPVLMTLLLVGGAVVGDTQAEDGVLDVVERTLGADVRGAIETMIDRAPQLGTGSLVTHGLGVFVFLFAALAGFRHLQRSFDIIWDARHRSIRASIFRVIRQIASFGLVMLVGVLFLAAASAGLIVMSFPEQVGSLVTESARTLVIYVLEAASISSLAFVILFFLYKIVPSAKVPWRGAFVGAVVASLCLALARYPLNLYMRHTWRTTTFGAAGFVVGLLVAFYGAASIVLIGAVVSRVVALRRTISGEHAEPTSVPFPKLDPGDDS